MLAEWLTKQHTERQSVPSWHCQVPCVIIPVISVPCPAVVGLKDALNGSLCCVQHKLWKVLKNIKKGCRGVYSGNSGIQYSE